MPDYNFSERKGETKTSFLYRHIKNDIMNGYLPAGERLPSKRDLAEHLRISVVTVENAYAQLAEEGFIVPRARSGFYVNTLPLLPSAPISSVPMEYLPEEIPAPSEGDILPRGMTRITRKILSERPDVLLIKPPALGCAVLRNAIADYLRRARGMEVLPSRIVIGSGAEYFYGLIVQLFGREISYGIESPSYERIEQVYRANGARIEYLSMGPDGISEDALCSSSAGVLHVTPYHSFPTGVTAAAKKRLRYLSWAAERDAVIVEDDFDSELSYFRRPIAPLFSMDRHDRVIYMNTFSKSISPAIRIAYMILPEEILASYKEKLGFYSCPVPVLDQYVLASFIADGSFERHLNRVRRGPG